MFLWLCAKLTDGILGQDFLRQHVDNINYRHSCLVMSSTTVPLWVCGTAKQICRVQAKDTVKIPANSRMWVPVKIPLADHITPIGLVEPSFELMGKKDMCALGGVVDTISNEIVLNIINYGSESTTLYKNTVVGTCESHVENSDTCRIAL